MIAESKTIDFRAIPKLTSDGNYQVNVPWANLEENLRLYNVDADPDFQRGHVWTSEQRIAYIENRLRGETSSRILRFNNPTFSRNKSKLPDISVLVDGKQRLTSVLMFLHDEIPAFDHLYSQFRRMDRIDFIFYVNNLETRAEVLKWYIELNSGGVVHTEAEINHVRALLEAERNHA